MKSLLSKCLPLIIAVTGFSLLLSPGCTKEKEEIPCVITVKYQIDTMRTVPFANVAIGQIYDDVRVDGKTDATGIFSTTFELEAILSVNASIDTNTGSGPDEPDLTGVATVRLKPGETAHKTVFIN